MNHACSVDEYPIKCLRILNIKKVLSVCRGLLKKVLKPFRIRPRHGHWPFNATTKF